MLILALGANDGLRGLPAAQMKDNLQAHYPPRKSARHCRAARRHGGSAELRGTIRPRFRQVFQDLARENKVALVPFLLEGVAGVPRLNQPDGIHPTRCRRGAHRRSSVAGACKKMIETGK